MLRQLVVTTGLMLGLFAGRGLAEAPPVEQVIAQTVESIRSNGSLKLAGVTIASTILLPDLYEQRNFQPLWTQPATIDDLLRAIRDASGDGLNPADYHLEAIERLRDGTHTDSHAVADLDLVLTDAFVQLAYHSRFGKVDPEQLDPNWNHTRALSGGEPVAALLKAVDSGQIQAFIQSLTPQQPSYRRLRDGLARYRGIEAAGGWPHIAAGPTLKPGMTDPRVVSVRQRLIASGDLPADAAGGQEYDAQLADGVKSFQDRHGLDTDGAIGPGTLKELNVTVAQRIEQIRATLERSRWVMNDLPERYVLVNVAGFRVYLIEHGERKWSSRVVVGTPYTKTPIFRADMKYIVLNPTWTVPASIVRKEILPGMRRDPNYLQRKGYEQVNGQFVQPAGERNALGHIKLMFPNSHSVYLHDTPSKKYFDETSRTFSHGCVRVQQPVELAALVLNDPAWSVAALEAAISTGKTRTVLLKEPIPVLILYWTAAVDADGRVTFRPDIYGRDPAVIHALDEEWKAPKRPPVGEPGA